VYVADAYNDTIRKITTAGLVSTLAGVAGAIGIADGQGAAARFNTPNALAVDSANNVYVADSENYTVREITPEGMVTTLGGVPGSYGSADGRGSAARFSETFGITVDAAGTLYVADYDNSTIRIGLPAKAIGPPILGAPTLAPAGFGAGVTGNIGLAVNLESSADFSTWRTVGTYLLDGGTNFFLDPTPPGGRSFYRIRVP
jgi:NHL repeat